MLKWKFFIMGMVLLLLCSCVNLEPVVDQTSFYALGLGPDRRPSIEKSALLKIHIDRPNLPSHVESVELRYIGSHGELHHLKNARWSEPVEYGVVRSLNAALAQHNRHFISYYPWPQPRDSRFILKLNVHTLSAHADGSFDFVADWKLESSDQLEAHRSLFAAVGVRWDVGDAVSLVAAWDRAISQLVTAVYGYCKPLLENSDSSFFRRP